MIGRVIPGPFIPVALPVSTTSPSDDDYEVIPYVPREPFKAKKGVQCGKCGLRVDNGTTMAYCCQSTDCPLGFGPRGVS